MLEAGQVVERGTHEELCKNDGLYASFAEEQRIEEDLAALSELDADAAISTPLPGAASAKEAT